MIDSELKHLKNFDECFVGMNVILFDNLMQLSPVKLSQVFHQHYHLAPATHVGYISVELTDNIR